MDTFATLVYLGGVQPSEYLGRPMTVPESTELTRRVIAKHREVEDARTELQIELTKALAKAIARRG